MEGGLSMKSVEPIYKSAEDLNSNCKPPRKSYSASDSSLDDGINDDKKKSDVNKSDSNCKRKRSRRSKSSTHQLNSSSRKEEFESDQNIFFHNGEGQSQSEVDQNGALYLPLQDKSSLRHIASDAAIYSLPTFQPYSDSQSSEFSDNRLVSLQGDSASSSDFNRSPRESIDSDIFRGIRE